MTSKSLVIAKDNPTWFGLPLLIASFYLFHFTNQNNDFPVFVKAGRNFLQRIDPWSHFDNAASMYLNGPTTLPLMSLFSLLPLAFGIFLLRVINLVLIFIVIVKEFGSVDARKSSAFISLIFLSSPFRSSMEYGQFTIIFGALGFLLLKRVLRNQGPIYTGLAMLVVIEYKPNIFGFLLIIAIVKNRFKVLSITLFFLVISEIVLEFWFGQLPFLSWYHAIQYRSLFASAGEDNLSFVPKLEISIVLIFALCLFLFVHFRKSFRILNFDSSIVLICIFLLITPLLHPTDLLILALLMLNRMELTSSSSLLLGLLMVWSPMVGGLLFAVILGSISILVLFVQSRNLFRQLLYFNIPNAIYLTFVRSGFHEPSIRHYLQLAFIVLLAISGLASLKKPHQHS